MDPMFTCFLLLMDDRSPHLFIPAVYTAAVLYFKVSDYFYLYRKPLSYFSFWKNTTLSPSLDKSNSCVSFCPSCLNYDGKGW